MKEEYIKEIIELPLRLAKTDINCLMFLEERKSHLDEKQANNLLATMRGFIEATVEKKIKHPELPQEKNDVKKALLPIFIYCFDKSIEIVYNILSENRKNVNFDYDDMLNGFGGDKVPEYIQLMSTPYIPKLAIILDKVVDFIYSNKEFKNDIDTLKELEKVILVGAIPLGSEFCLQIYLNNQDE